MDGNDCKVLVVECGSAEGVFGELESQWFDKMKIRSGVGAQPDYVAGVLRYFRGYKCHVEGHAFYFSVIDLGGSELGL